MIGRALSIALVTLASDARAQTLGQAAGGTGVSPWRVLAALLLCAALAVVAVVVLRRRYGTPGPFLGALAQPKRIQVIEQQYLGPQRSLCLIAIDGEEYLCLFTAQTATMVLRRPARSADHEARHVQAVS